MNGAVPLLTPRLALRPPRATDAAQIFGRFAADAEVTRYLSWRRHRDVDDTLAFLDFSAREWARWPAGPLLIESRADGSLLGSTGLAFETADRASTGYLLARDAWGRGYATEALTAVIELARAHAVRQLSALCHASHAASMRVLERCSFVRERTLTRHAVFPNLGDDEPQDVVRYQRFPAEDSVAGRSAGPTGRHGMTRARPPSSRAARRLPSRTPPRDRP